MNLASPIGEQAIGIRVSRGLGFYLEGWPGGAASLARQLLSYYVVSEDRMDGWSCVQWHDSLGCGPASETGEWEWRPAVGTSPPIDAKVTLRISPDGERARIVAPLDLDESAQRQIVWSLVPILLGELAIFRGCLLVHAAAIGWGEKAMLLPAESGSGKSTIFQAAFDSGRSVLSDDLVWLCPPEDDDAHERVYAFPRGGLLDPPPAPTAPHLPLGLLVFPAIGDEAINTVDRLSATETLRRLNHNCLGIGAPAGLAHRFRAVTRVASKIPGFSWLRPRHLV